MTLSVDTKAVLAYQSRSKSIGVSYALWLFLGGLGAHRYYNGRIGSGLAILALVVLGWLTALVGIGLLFLAIAGVWLIVDAFLIPGWVSRHNALLIAQLDSGRPPEQA